MPTRTVQLPAVLCEQLSSGKIAISARIRELASRELREHRPLSVIPSSMELDSVPVPIPETLSDELQDLRGRRGIGSKDSEARILARLAYTHLTAEAPRAHEEDRSRIGSIANVADLLRALPRPPREEQELLARDLQPIFGTSDIALLEAATGTGKGLVIAASAYAVAAGGQRALICAPTHQLNAQTLEDLRLIMATHGPVNVEVVFGRSSFVSPTRLSEALGSEEIPADQREVAQRWIEEELRLYRSGARKGRFMISKLEEQLPEFPARDVALTPSHSDEAAATYQEQFERAIRADIVIATMAMLALEAFTCRRDATRQTGLTIPRGISAEERKNINLHERNRELIKVAGHGRLGPFFAVFVDEAHRLEEQFALAASKEISVFSLVTQIRDMPVPAEAKAEIKRAYEGLQALGRKTDSLRISHGDDSLADEGRHCLRGLLSGLEKATRRRPPSVDAQAFQQIKDTVSTLKREVLGVDAASNISTIDFSPIYRYPRVCVGPRSVRATLDFFWQQFRCGATFSATLYVTSPSGLRSAGYVAQRLSIPIDRRREHVPIIPNWVTDPVTLHLPDSVAHARWAPPKMGTPADDAQWAEFFDQHAAAIARIATDARGGTLVLCTSYLAVQQLSARLRAGHPDRLIESVPSKFNVALREFYARANSGQRPIWISVGSAWTGMNVYVETPMPAIEDDRILTDLVIPKLPYNLNRLSTEIARRQRSEGQFAFIDGMIDCALMVLQGCGRLIRRQGLKDRHLWILDPRSTQRGAATFAGIWRRYRQQRPIEISVSARPNSPAATSSKTAKAVLESTATAPTAKKPLFSIKK